MKKRVLSLVLAGATIATPILSTGNIYANEDTNTSNALIESIPENKKIDVTTYSFKYKDAPQELRAEYEKSCSDVGIIPSDDAEISTGDSSYADHPASVKRNAYIERVQNRLYITKNGTMKTGSVVLVQRGAVGTNVEIIQHLLTRAGYTVTIDSNFGPSTESAVKSFQRKYTPTGVDGKVGTNTWNKLSGWANSWTK